jgi:HTH-type transcriptional regulator/antitoxin HigA
VEPHWQPTQWAFPTRAALPEGDGKKETFVDDGRGDGEREARANRFAANHLIPTDCVYEFPRLRTWATVESFAQGIGIAPGIVVGRLPREGILRRNQLNGLKRRLRWVRSRTAV